MTELASRGGGEYDLAPASLGDHLTAYSAGYQPRAVYVGLHHSRETIKAHLADGRHVVHAGGDHENINTAVRGHGCLNDLVRVGFAVGTQRDRIRLYAGAGQLRSQLRERARITGGNRQARSSAAQGRAG